MIAGYGDCKRGSRNLNFEKPKDHHQEDGSKGFIQGRPAVCGLEKAAVGEAVCYTDPFESLLRFRKEFLFAFVHSHQIKAWYLSLACSYFHWE